MVHFLLTGAGSSISSKNATPIASLKVPAGESEFNAVAYDYIADSQTKVNRNITCNSILTSCTENFTGGSNTTGVYTTYFKQ